MISTVVKITSNYPASASDFSSRYFHVEALCFSSVETYLFRLVGIAKQNPTNIGHDALEFLPCCESEPGAIIIIFELR